MANVDQLSPQAVEEAIRVASISSDVLDRLLEGCQVIGFDWTYLYVNEVTVRQGRLSKAELIGRTMMECYPGIDATPMFTLLRRSMKERTTEQMENDFTFPDGKRLVFQLRFIPVPQGVCILSLDITERRHQLAAIVSDSDDAIIGRTLDGVVTNWNRGAEHIFGYSAEEMVGRNLDVLSVSDLANEERAMAARLVKGERIDHFETKRKHKDGREIDVSVTISPVRDFVGSIIGVSQIARDITEWKRVQTELVNAKEKAENANRELESFSYTVAHDLRAPLRGIDGFSQILLDDYADKLDDEGRKYLRYVRESAQLMSQLIDDMLTLSRVTRQDLVRTKIDLSELARTAFSHLARMSPTRQVELVVQPDLVDKGDAQLLTALFNNLLGNAWKFTSKREKARIEFGLRMIDGVPTYFVADNGAGFDMSYVSKLFGVFQRLHAASEFEGTGVGLATVQRIVQRHGGRVWAEAAVNVGATFYFTLGH